MAKKKFVIDFGRYYRPGEMGEVLAKLAAAYPELATLHSIGKSRRGRDLWLIEVTNRKTGPASQKPAYYIDGVTHAEELSGAMVSLYTAWYLLTNYGQDDMVTRLLDRQAFYILPMVNPDGAEIVQTLPFFQWIGNGLYLPGEEQFGPGLHYADVNGDGDIVDMRIPDPAGEWKVSEKDPRLLVQREPYEDGGQYYRLMPEGLIQDYDGANIAFPRPMDGNLNRNYPAGWGSENEQYGAGEYPMSEPEIKAVVEFTLAHPNIFGALNYHTNAGAFLLPFSAVGRALPYEDLVVFKRIAEAGVQETGYGVIANETDFNSPGAKPRQGTSDELLYWQLGVSALVTELWDVYAASGIKKDWFYQHRLLSEEEEQKLLKWSDEQLNGQGFLSWTPFEHPQLGRVELGGWRRLYMFRNPPPAKLEEMCRSNALFTLKHAATAPRVAVTSLKATPLAADLFRVEAVVTNMGFMPTYVTRQAVHASAAKPVIARLDAGSGAELAAGTSEVDLGHLAGRSERGTKYSRFNEWHTPARKAEWVVRLGQAEAVITVTAQSERAGQDTHTLTLRRGA